MAKQLNSYEVKLAFTADTRAAKAQLQDLQSQLTNISTGTSFSAKGLPITNEIQKGMDAAAQLKVLLEDATNVNTGKLDLTKFESSLRSGKVNLQELAGDLKMLGPEGARAFSQLAVAVNNAETPIISMNAHMQEFFTTLKNTARWQISSSILHGFMGALQSAYGYAQDLNESLTNIRIVTGYSSERMADFAKEANNAAKALSTTTNEYANASLIYFQQGLSDEEVKARTDVTVRMAQVTGQGMETTSDQLTAIWNNFAEGSENLEYYADVITALGAATASSSEEISTGLNKFAAAANTVGLSYEYATAALATVTATTRQSADTVGTAFRTLFSRLEGLKLGETLEDGVDLNKYSEALNKVGINILDQQNQLKDMDTILQDLATRWQTLEKNEKVALATTVGGVRQYTTLMALMDNWDFMEENLETARKSSGTLAEQAKIYAESWEAAQKRVRTALEGIYQQLIDDKFFIGLNNLFADILNNVSKLISGLGGVKGVLLIVSNLLLQVFGNNLANTINSVYTLLTTKTVDAKQQMQDALNVFGDSDFREHLEQRLDLQQQLVDKSDLLTEAEKKALAIQLDRLRVAQEISEAYDEQIKALQGDIKTSYIQRSFDYSKEGTFFADNKEYYNEFVNSIQGRSGLKFVAKRFTSDDFNSKSDITATLDFLEKQGIADQQKIVDLRKVLQDNTKDLSAIFKDNAYITLLDELNGRQLTILDEDEQALRELLKQGNFGEDKINDLINKINEAGTKAAQKALSDDNANKIIGNFSDKLDKTTKNFGANLTTIAQGISGTVSGLTILSSSFQNLGTSIAEGNLSLGTFLTLIPSVIMGISSLNAGLQLLKITIAPKTLLIFTAVLGALTTAISYLSKRSEAAANSIEKANQKFKESTEEVEKLKNELAEVNERIDELGKKKGLSIVEEEELERLNIAQDLLEEQIRLQELKAKQDAKDAAQEFFKNSDTAYKYKPYQNNLDFKSEGPVYNLPGNDLEERRENAWAQYGDLEKRRQKYLEIYNALGEEGRQQFQVQLENERKAISENFQQFYSEINEDYATKILEPILKTGLLSTNAVIESVDDLSDELKAELEKRAIDFQTFVDAWKNKAPEVIKDLKPYDIDPEGTKEKSLAKSLGYDEEELEEYKNHLQELAKDGVSGVTDSLKNNNKAATQVALAHMRLNAGLETLGENYEEWIAEIRRGNKTTTQYHEALKGLKSATEEILNLDINSLSGDFFNNAENLNLLEQAAQGSTDAVEALRRAAADDILLHLNADIAQSTIDKIHTRLDGLQDYLANTNFEIGSIRDEKFLESCRQIVADAKMTATEAANYFKALGYDLQFESTPLKEEPYETYKVVFDPITHEPIPPTEYTNTVTRYAQTIKAITWTGTAGGSVSYKNTGAGKASKKGGGGSSKKEVKTAKNFEDEIDRYHKINAEIANQERLLTNLGKAKDRAYGKDKVAAIQAEFDALGRSSALLSEKLEEAKGYKAVDAARLSTFGGVIDENGVISNYKEMYAAQWQAIRDAYATYNASVQDEAAKEALQNAEDHYEAFKDAISKFEGSQEQVEDLIDAIADNYYERLSKKIEEINAAVEVRVTIDEDSLKKVQHALDMTDDFAFFGVERVSMLQTELDPLLDKMDVTRRQIVDLVRQGQMTEFTDEIIDNIRDAQGNLMDYEKQLKELNATLREEFPNAVQEATDAIDNFGSTFKHYSSVLDHYKDLLDLTGRSQRDFGLNMRLAAAQTKVASDATSAAVANYKLLLQSQEETQKLLDNAIASGDRDEMSYWKKQLDEVTQKVQSAKEDILTAWKETLQAAANEYEVAVNQTIATLERQISPYLSLDQFADAYKKAKDILDEYVTSNEQIYQLNKLVRQVEDVLSKSTSDAAAAKMNELKDEIDARKQILDIEGESHNLSEYDIEYLQKKYQLTLAQMQLEDAQDAKTTMRLSRDASGNYSYIYTANQDNIDQAAQNYEDKLRELEKLSEDYIEQLSDQIISNYQAMTKTMSSLRAENFENEEDFHKALEEAQAYYLTRDNYFKSEMTKALGDLGTTYDQTTFGIIENHGDLETSHFDLAENTARANDEMEDAWVHWKDTTDKVKDEFNDIVGDINEDIGSVENKSDELKDKIENEVYPILRDFLKNTATDVQGWQETYVRSIDNAIQANHEFLASIEALKNTSFSADEGLGIAEPIVKEMGVVADVSTAMSNAGEEALATAGSGENNGDGVIPKTPPAGPPDDGDKIEIPYVSSVAAKAIRDAYGKNWDTAYATAQYIKENPQFKSFDEDPGSSKITINNTYNDYGDKIGTNENDQQANTPTYWDK